MPYHMKQKVRKVRKVTRNLSFITAVEKELLSELFLTSEITNRSIKSGDNILIVGGELFNKGAQAMTFTIVDKMSSRYPEKNVILLSGKDYQRPAEEKSQYNFEILPWGPEVQLSMLSNVGRVNTTEYSSADIDRVQDVFSASSFVIDINGYALSSQRGFRNSLLYLTNIIIAKKYDLPMYILPQSIGPFDYPTPKKLFLNPFMQTYLSYPEIIAPREKDGVDALSPYTQANVERAFDIVLQNDEYDLGNIFRVDPDVKEKNIESDAVGIVPNSKVFDRKDPKELYSLYETVIDELVDTGRTIYVFQHSVEDLNHCVNIKDRFENEDQVILLKQEWNAFELEYIIEQFDFMIASRYHSIIHAYRNHVPVLAIGWAIKYQELLDEFNQLEFFFEGREQIDPPQLRSAVEQMSMMHGQESEKIKQRAEEIKENNLLDRLFA